MADPLSIGAVSGGREVWKLLASWPSTTHIQDTGLFDACAFYAWCLGYPKLGVYIRANCNVNCGCALCRSRVWCWCVDMLDASRVRVHCMKYERGEEEMGVVSV